MIMKTTTWRNKYTFKKSIAKNIAKINNNILLLYNKWKTIELIGKLIH
jgi:hypothetical protein